MWKNKPQHQRWKQRQDKIVDMVQRRNYGGLDHSLTLEMREGFIWIQPAGLPNGLDVKYEGKRGFKDDSIFYPIPSSFACSIPLTVPSVYVLIYSTIYNYPCPLNSWFFTLYHSDLFKAQKLSVGYYLL